MSRVIEQNGAGASNIGLVAGNVLAGSGLVLGLLGFVDGLAPLRGIGVFLLAIGSWMIWVGLRGRRQARLVGPATLSLSRNKIRPGDRVEARLTATLAEGVEVAGLGAQLVERGVEVRRSRGSSEARHVRRDVRTVDADEVRLVSATGELVADLVLVVPTTPHDVGSIYDETWSVRVALQLASGDEVARSFDYRVR